MKRNAKLFYNKGTHRSITCFLLSNPPSFFFSAMTIHYTPAAPRHELIRPAFYLLKNSPRSIVKLALHTCIYTTQPPTTTAQKEQKISTGRVNSSNARSRKLSFIKPGLTRFPFLSLSFYIFTRGKSSSKFPDTRACAKFSDFLFRPRLCGLRFRAASSIRER